MLLPKDIFAAYERILKEVSQQSEEETLPDEVPKGPAQYSLELTHGKLSEFQGHLVLDETKNNIIGLTYGWLENAKDVRNTDLTTETIWLTASMSALGRFAEECGLTYRFGLNSRHEPMVIVGSPLWKDDVVILQPPAMH